MIYRLVYTRRAVKDIDKLDVEWRKRISKALKRYEQDPLKYSEKIMDKQLGEFRFRIGNYRVIFDIHGDEVVILRVGHRKEIYRR